MKTANSLSQASALTGYPVHVLKLARQHGCKAFRGGRVVLPVFRKWVADNPHLIESVKDLPSKEEMDIKLKQARLAEQEMINGKLDGSLISRADHERALAGIARTFWPRIRAQVEQATPEEAEKQLRDIGVTGEPAEAVVKALREHGIAFIDECEADFARMAEEPIE